MFSSEKEEAKQRRHNRKAVAEYDRRQGDSKLQNALKQHEQNFVSESPQDRFLRQQVNKIWGKFDEDRNGVLDRQEMCQFVRELTEGTIDDEWLTEDNLRRVFESFDVNNDGSIDKDEMFAFVKYVTRL